jgi:hypothetical protein
MGAVSPRNATRISALAMYLGFGIILLPEATFQIL